MFYFLVFLVFTYFLCQQNFFLLVFFIQGHWVLLHNAHNSPRLLAALDSFMQETKTVDSEFRLWVSVQPHPDIPSSLLQSAVKVVADSPKVRL